MKYQRYLLLVLAYAFLLLPSAAFSRRVPNDQKKIIHFGFVSPSTPDHMVMEALKNMDATCPFDGIGINPIIKLKRGGKTIVYNPLSQVVFLQQQGRVWRYRRLWGVSRDATVSGCCDVYGISMVHAAVVPAGRYEHPIFTAAQNG